MCRNFFFLNSEECERTKSWATVLWKLFDQISLKKSFLKKVLEKNNANERERILFSVLELQSQRLPRSRRGRGQTPTWPWPPGGENRGPTPPPTSAARTLAKLGLVRSGDVVIVFRGRGKFMSGLRDWKCKFSETRRDKSLFKIWSEFLKQGFPCGKIINS